YLRLSLPENAPFALKPSPGKGWGCFATRYIRRGSIILHEQAWFIFGKSLHELSESDMQECYNHLNGEQKRQFSHLGRNARTLYASKLDALRDNLLPLIPGLDTFGTMNVMRCGLLPISSRFNHSCLPNACIASVQRGIQAVKSIQEGDEINLCYGNSFEVKTTEERARELPFVCICEACNPERNFHYLSDMRRRLLQGIYYLTRGCNINVMHDTQENAVIEDITLKMRSENSEHSSVFLGICYHIRALLLEAEGLATPGLIKTYFYAAMSGPRPSRMEILQARNWMIKALEVMRYVPAPDLEERLDFEALEQQLWSDD
ncbi:MAG: hypothetical protein Q9157_006824, partial [Trypethelium eluteriae]